MQVKVSVTMIHSGDSWMDGWIQGKGEWMNKAEGKLVR